MQTDLTFNGYHLPTLARVIKEMGSPTEGYAACLIWNLTNMASLPVPYAEELARAAGYEPFQGYPLTRAVTRG